MNPPELLTRDEFRNAVFARDKHMCVFCDSPAADAHHILERRLWPDGGYYIENGASVCGEHHMKCEMTEISVENVREACGITRAVIPPHLYDDQRYDKWGNPILENGQRLKGELFHDESVQKVLHAGGALGSFSHLVKFPRTHHLPFSEGVNDDDRVIGSLDTLLRHEVVVTEKMDGENTTMYRDYIHARSVDGRSHSSRDWVKNFWSGIREDIPEGWRICGENLFALHSIPYTGLPTYFMGFSVWNDRNVCLPWTESLEWFSLLGITPVPELRRGVLTEKDLRTLASTGVQRDTSEGFVVRVAGEIVYGEYRTKVAKWVRKGHVQTVKHWMHGQPIVKNRLCSTDM